MRLYFNNHTRYIVISETNTKMGPVPSFSTPSGLSCPKGVPCLLGCYARAIEKQRGTVKQSYINNMMMLRQYHDTVRQLIIGYLKLNDWVKHFRFNVAGDVEADPQNPMGYINLMCEVAKACPEVKFLCFSKSPLWNFVDIPQNLNVVYSSWGDWHVENPFNFPTTNVCKKPKKGEEPPEGLEICPNSKDKSKHCAGCWKCWNLKKGDKPIYFYAHGVNANKIEVDVPKYEAPKKEEVKPKPKKVLYRDSKGRFVRKPVMTPSNNLLANAILGQAIVKVIKEMSPL